MLKTTLMSAQCGLTLRSLMKSFAPNPNYKPQWACYRGYRELTTITSTTTVRCKIFRCMGERWASEIDSWLKMRDRFLGSSPKPAIKERAEKLKGGWFRQSSKVQTSSCKKTGTYQ